MSGLSDEKDDSQAEQATVDASFGQTIDAAEATDAPTPAAYDSIPVTGISSSPNHGISSGPLERSAISNPSTSGAIFVPVSVSMQFRTSPNLGQDGVLPFTGWDRYEIKSLLGAGGMGVVYKAWDPQLQRFVALKFLRHASLSEAVKEKFLREARAQARIEHPHVCKIFEVGSAFGHPYIAMQYIEGKPLSQLRREMTVDQCVAVMRSLSDAVHAAHQLDLIHRDLKPANILVERGDDGRFRPFVLDFGLAREVASQGSSNPVAIEGTPSYMSPEQARGEVTALDRRTDVYGLGAMLYELLCGRPPFAGKSRMDVLLAVLTTDPTSPLQLNPRIPRDLAAIALKCLEKEPQHRYDSARALHEDLTRFRDGEPVLANAQSPLYRLLKRARKHKLLVGVLVGALAFLITLLVIGVRASLWATEEAHLAQQIGQDVKEMELFLRYAYGLPLHEPVAEKALTRARMQRIESTLPRLRIGGQALGHYALGRGHLVLHEYAPAEAQLQKAWELGMRAPELHYALGLALGERYRSALLDAQRQTAPSALDRRKQELRAQFLLPALTHLRESSGVRLEAPAYVEGLIAFYNEQPALALQKAEEALRQAPWLPEPKKLMADVHYAKGFALRHEGKYAESRKELKAAVTLYQEAEAISRSDADIYVAEAETWAEVIKVDVNDGNNADEDFLLSQRAIKDLSQVLPGNAELYRISAHADLQFALSLMAVGKDPSQFLERAIASSESALALKSNQCNVLEMMGFALLAKYLQQSNSSVDPSETVEKKAISVLSRAISCNPNSTLGHNQLGIVYCLQARNRSLRGIDTEPEYQMSIREFEKTIDISPQEDQPYTNILQLYENMGRNCVDYGCDLSVYSEGVKSIHRRAMNSSVGGALALNNIAAYQINVIRRSLFLGENLNSAFGELIKYANQALALNPSNYETYQVLAEAHLLMAEAEVARDSVVAAGAQIDEGLVAAQKAISLKADDARSHKLLGQLLALQAAQLGKKARQPAFEAARVAAERAVALNPRDPAHSQALAEVWLRTAQWQRLRHKSLDESIAAGLLATTAALRINPRHPYSFVTRGALLLEQALATRAKPARQATLVAAREALTTAVTHNKLLTKQVAPLLDAVAAQLTPQ